MRSLHLIAGAKNFAFLPISCYCFDIHYLTLHLGGWCYPRNAKDGLDICSESKGCNKVGEKWQSDNTESLSTVWSGPLSYASVVMSTRDTPCDWKERQQRVLFDAATGSY